MLPSEYLSKYKLAGYSNFATIKNSQELIEALSNYDEDVVLVMYGDHLPSLGIENENLTYDNNFETPYVMWSNFNLPKEDKNFYDYIYYWCEKYYRNGFCDGIELIKYS